MSDTNLQRRIPVLRLQLWLKWKLGWRLFRQGAAELIGTLLSLLVYGPVALGVAFFCGVGFFVFEPPLNEHLLRATLLGIYLIWIIGSILGMFMPSPYNITTLFVYPLTLRQIFIGSTLGSLFDFSVFLMVPTILVVLVMFTHSITSVVFVWLPLCLYIFHTLSLSQIVMLFYSNIKKNRQVHDVLQVLGPIVGVVAVLPAIFIYRWKSELSLSISDFIESKVWDWVSYLPAGLAARAIAAGAMENYTQSTAYILALAVCTVATVYLAVWVLRKSASGGFDSSGRLQQTSYNQKASTGTRTTSPWTFFLQRIPTDLGAVLGKEIRYVFRDPYIKMVLVNGITTVALMMILWILPFTREVVGTSPIMVWGLTYFALFTQVQTLGNIYGIEGKAVETLFLYPISRRYIIMGKNIVMFVANALINLVILCMIMLFTDAWSFFGILAFWMILATAVMVGLGNVISIWLPYRLATHGPGVQANTPGVMMLHMFISGISAAIGLGILFVIIAAPVLWLPAIYGLVSMPMALLYTLVFYKLTLHWSLSLLSRREIQIVEKLVN